MQPIASFPAFRRPFSRTGPHRNPSCPRCSRIRYDGLCRFMAMELAHRNRRCSVALERGALCGDLRAWRVHAPDGARFMLCAEHRTAARGDRS
jgi:hypothetical protein